MGVVPTLIGVSGRLLQAAGMMATIASISPGTSAKVV